MLGIRNARPTRRNLIALPVKCIPYVRVDSSIEHNNYPNYYTDI